ncbi:MAG: helix-turn-helix domain-containing protein [Desulfovibrio sp.]|nr:helix-turn-helix domain-containing protein [Desulfovibrio sp.]
MDDQTTGEKTAVRSLPGAVAYQPCLLNSLREICEAFHVSAPTVKQWVSRQAPIVVEGVGAKRRYSAELSDLHAWRKRQAGVA